MATQESEAPLKGKSPMEIGNYAKRRWYVERQRGPDLVFYDSLANRGGQSQGLVRQALLTLGATTADLDGEGESDGALKMLRPSWTWIQHAPIYRQWSPPIYLDRDTGYTSRNLWRQAHPRAEEAPDVSPFLTMLNRCYGHEPEAVEFLLDTLAFRLQVSDLPRQELMFLFYSEHGAAGKGSVLDTIEEVFGRDAGKRTNFRSAFKDQNAGENWIGNYILLDESTVKREHMEALKASVSTAVVSANAKNTGAVDYTINALPFLASNDLPSLDDAVARRMVLLESRLAELEPDQSKRATELTAYKEWLRLRGGAEAVFQWLYLRDTSAYKPFRDAPATVVKRRVMGVMQSSVQQMLGEWVAEEEALVFNFSELQKAAGLSSNEHQYRHQLDAAGLSAPVLKKLPNGAERRSVKIVLKQPWALRKDVSQKNRLVLDSGEETIPLTEAPGYSDLFGTYDLTL